VQLSANSPPAAEGRSPPPVRRRYSKNAVTLKYPAVHTLVLAVGMRVLAVTLTLPHARIDVDGGRRTTM
jgi:hypothetical protein